MGAVSLTGVTQQFGELRALDGLSVDFAQDRVTGLVGRNGAGKSSLLNLVSGRTRATSGSVRVLGEDPHENRRVLAHVCAVTEDQPYPARYTVQSCMHAAALLHPRWDRALAGRLLELFALPRGQRVGGLSRGQRSAVGVVIALAARAPVTLLDEPYAGLDTVARQQFYAELGRELGARPRTVIFSSHLVDEVSHLLDEVVIVDRGRVVVAGPASEVPDLAVALARHRTDADEEGSR